MVCDAVEKDCPKLEPLSLNIEHWPLPDPSETTGGRELQLEAFRQTLEELRNRIAAWLEELPN